MTLTRKQAQRAVDKHLDGAKLFSAESGVYVFRGQYQGEETYALVHEAHTNGVAAVYLDREGEGYYGTYVQG